jgi:predicted amidohydrolase
MPPATLAGVRRPNRSRSNSGAAAPPVRPVLTLGVAQTAPRPRDMPYNAARVAELAHSAGADILLTPELSLTGYDLRDSVHRLGITASHGQPLGVEELRGAPGAVVVGMVEAAAGGPYNTAVVARDGSVAFAHRKIHLPTYGMFDEGRWFGRGARIDTWRRPDGWTCGLLICEDFWHPGLLYVLASRGIDVLLVQAAAPGRGLSSDAGFASAGVWERMACTAAQLYGVYVALCNRVGVEGGVSFAGGSVIAGPDGSVLARADDSSECVLTAEISQAALERSRVPYFHGRDDDPYLVIRELQRGASA